MVISVTYALGGDLLAFGGSGWCNGLWGGLLLRGPSSSMRLF